MPKTKFVSVAHSGQRNAISEKYVKQTYDAMSDTNINLESIAIQIASLPVREQKKFFRLFLNYVDITSQKSIRSNITMRDVIQISERIVELVTDYYEEQENQLAFEGM